MLLASPVLAEPLKILSAESVYGQVAAAIAGDRAAVTSVLSNPAQDPHDFEARPSTARAAAQADIVALNGAGYDPWMEPLLAASARAGRDVISVAILVQARPGMDPHLWYDPKTMPRFAQALAAALTRHDPPGGALYSENLQKFLAGMARLQSRIDAMRTRVAGSPVTATEPVFIAMAAALGLNMHGRRFQLAVMNGTEPRASDVAAMEADLREHRVRALINNIQVTGTASARVIALARQSGIPVVAITETLPRGRDYVGWMLSQLDALDHALALR